MLQITSLTINANSQNHLDSKQASINGQTSYEAEINQAKTFWASKKGSNNGRLAFEEVEDKLKLMAVATCTCNYCEHNEGTDIEHIFPKSLYPNRAFVWENYLWACKICNTTYKSAKFKTFNATNTNQHTDITPPNRGRAYVRPNNDALLINPRSENPMDFLWLDLTTGFFAEIAPQNTRNWERANYTIDLLKLNNRAELVAARKKALQDYFNNLQRYIEVLNAQNFNELDEAYDEIVPLNQRQPFQQVKNQCCLNIQEAILTYPHPTVWEEMKRQHLQYTKLENLFNQVPVALTWSI